MLSADLHSAGGAGDYFAGPASTPVSRQARIADAGAVAPQATSSPNDTCCVPMQDPASKRFYGHWINRPLKGGEIFVS